MNAATTVLCCALLLIPASWTQAASAPHERAAASQEKAGGSHETAAGPQEPPIAKGETVAEIDKSCWIVFQDKSGNHWFGSDGAGVSRFDGKTITRFTTRDGLAHDQVRGIQQHGPSGDILIATNAGVSKFDGKRFVTLAVSEMKPPGAAATSSGPSPASSGSSAAAPTAFTDAALADAGWVLRADDVWLIGGGGPRRYDGKTLYQLKFPKSPLHDELTARLGAAKNWTPYDVWTVYKDSKGQMWFGTAMFGICRFDGRSFDWMYEPHLTELPGGAWFGFRSIAEDRSGDFWFCSTQFRYRMQPHAAGEQGDGRLKYTREKGIDLAGSATTDKYFHYQSITADNNRDLWMAPYGGGVWRYDGKRATHYPMKVGDEEITMFSIYKDNRGDIWVGTHENGAYKLNGKAFERFRP